jgi:predicted alpha/beta superfamily hydrolase
MKAVAAAEFPQDLLGDEYVRFLVEELKPRVDAAYRTRPDRASTFVMGSSMGALISLYAMAERPDVFGGAGCLSMHWPVGVDSTRVFDNARTWRPAIVAAFTRYFRAARLEPSSHRLWVDHGTGFLDEHYVRYQAAMLPVLRRLGYVEHETLEARVYPGANHNETAWRARLREPLRFLLAGGT